MSPCPRLRGLALWCACCALACVPLREPPALRARAPAPAYFVGRISLPPDVVSLGAAAVFLERIEAPEPGADEALAAVVVAQRDGHFEPEFAIAAIGQPVLFVNRAEIFQASFSYSKPNQFECRAFGPGDACIITFRDPGLVRTYSPLDADTRGMVLVVPGAHYAVPDARGVFRIDGVAPGRYRASVWTEQHGSASREIALDDGAVARGDFELDPR